MRDKRTPKDFCGEARQNGSSRGPLSAILVQNYGQDRMTFFVSQAQPGFGRCYLRTSSKDFKSVQDGGRTEPK